MFERFTENAIKVIELAQKEAIWLGHNLVGTEMILSGLIGEGTDIAAKVFESMGIGLNDTRVEVDNALYMVLGYSYPKGKKVIGKCSGIVDVEIPFTSFAKDVIEMSIEEAQKHGHNYIGTEHLLLGLLQEDGVALRVLESLGLDRFDIHEQVMKMVEMVEESAELLSKMPTLEKYGTNLTKLAQEFKLDHAVERQPQIERVAQFPGGVTKTNPETIDGKKMLTVDMGRERLKKLMKLSDEIVLLIDEGHALMGSRVGEGAIDAA